MTDQPDPASMSDADLRAEYVAVETSPVRREAVADEIERRAFDRRPSRSLGGRR